MQSTGITRKVDVLGRIVLPMELRRNLDVKEGDDLEIYTDNENIILRKHQPACVFCDTDDNIIEFNGRHVCTDCIAQIKSS